MKISCLVERAYLGPASWDVISPPPRVRAIQQPPIVTAGAEKMFFLCFQGSFLSDWGGGRAHKEKISPGRDFSKICGNNKKKISPGPGNCHALNGVVRGTTVLGGKF